MSRADSRTSPVTTTPPQDGTGPIQLMKAFRLPQRLRNLELGLLIFACLINTGAVVLVQLGALGHIDTDLLFFGASLSALVFGLHIAMRFVAKDADPFILPIATVLNGLGIAMIYRIDIANDDMIGWKSAATRQIVWSAIALCCAIVVILAVRNHRVLFRYTYIAGFSAVAMLLLPLVPGLGQEVQGARVWIGIGSLATFQPGEIAKIALAVFFAGYLVRNKEVLSSVGRKILGMRFPRLRDLGPILVVWALSMAVIIFQHDLGTGLLYFGLFLVTLYVATGRLSWVCLGLALFIGGAVIASQSLSYVHGRIANWLDPFNDANYAALGGSYQVVQGLFGLANGGLIGTGLGQGHPETTPVSQSDYIIASLGEELGLVGVIAILSLYLLFVARGLRIGFAGQDDFGKLLAVGLAFSVALQVFIVVGGVTRVLPLTGLTTPFLAAGGSSLVANWIIVGLLLRISDTVRNQPKAMV